MSDRFAWLSEEDEQIYQKYFSALFSRPQYRKLSSLGERKLIAVCKV